MIGKTLSLYIATRFVRTTIGMMLGLFFLIVTVDFVEQLRKATELDVSMARLYMISLTKAPVFLEQAFPFGCLFATMITLTQLNTKMELVVARAAGVSAWQFLLPISATAMGIGLLVAMAYNPLAIFAMQASDEITADVFGKSNFRNIGDVKGYWIQQQTGNGITFINAKLAREGGKLLNDVKFIEFDKQGKIQRRIDATNAIYRGKVWMVINAKVTELDGQVKNESLMSINTNISERALLGITADPVSVSFWQLTKMAKIVRDSGGNPGPYLVQFDQLTALPLFLVAMVLIAAIFSLKFVRFGQLGRMILGGILSGFVLYTVTSLVKALGSNQIVPPIAAAWAPAIVAVLFGMSVLLYQEDG